MADGVRGEGARGRRITYLTFGSGEYDARTFRMARTALAAGYEVTVYARWYPGLPVEEERDGYRIVRVPFDWRLAVPGLRRSARRRLAKAMAAAPPGGTRSAGGPPRGAAPSLSDEPGSATPAPPVAGTGRRSLLARARRRLLEPGRKWRRHWWRILRLFPLNGLGWAAALDSVAEPADIWHGMWAGSLPALARMRHRFGGRTIYDSRDVYMQSRDLAHAGSPGKLALAWLERRWARMADAVLTVNDAYAEILAAQLGIPTPPVVMNLPLRWVPPEPRPDRIRAVAGVSPDTAIVLYQGGLMTARGIEQAMEAILEVPGAVLCLLGFGALRDTLVRQAAEPPYLGRVIVLDPVPPEELLEWTASADVSVMAIQPTSLNHRYTTPQKLFESMAAGVPVVASDLPGMGDIVRETDAGRLCDPTSPAAIAAAIRDLIAEPEAAREARRTRILRAAHERYNWEAEEPALLAFYEALG